MKMPNPAVCLLASIVSLCAGCDHERNAVRGEEIERLKKQLAAQDAEIGNEKEIVARLKKEKLEIRNELKKTNESLVKEIHERLAVIESEHTTTVSSNADIDEGLKTLQVAETEFLTAAQKAAERSKTFQKFASSYDSVGSFMTGDELMGQLVEILEQNAALTAELERLRANTKKSEQGAAANGGG